MNALYNEGKNLLQKWSYTVSIETAIFEWLLKKYSTELQMGKKLLMGSNFTPLSYFFCPLGFTQNQGRQRFVNNLEK